VANCSNDIAETVFKFLNESEGYGGDAEDEKVRSESIATGCGIAS
jgi:hypothetical protein